MKIMFKHTQKANAPFSVRIGNLKLEIELGRYVRTTVSDRICKVCKQYIEVKFILFFVFFFLNHTALD